MAAQCPPITPNLPPLPLPEGIISSYIRTPALTYHILSSGAPTTANPTKKPLILLLHGFPELAYSWRKVMVELSELTRESSDTATISRVDREELTKASKAKGPADGYHVVAYDQRGYGRTTGWDTKRYHDVDLNTFRMTEVVKDAVRLVNALGYTECACIVGHDFGAVGASLSAMIRPDVFKRVVMMSHPFSAIPWFPIGKNEHDVAVDEPNNAIAKCLGDLSKPQFKKKHYKWYYSSVNANEGMTYPKQGLKDFLRGYFYLKSGNNILYDDPFKLKAWDAEELDKMPGYYIMPMHKSMSEYVAEDMMQVPLRARAPAKQWLTDAELEVYVEEFRRNGFQGGLNYYRVGTSPQFQSDLELFRGKKIEVPSLFVSGDKDWGPYQTPGALDEMKEACPGSRGFLDVYGAGHWVMQEEPQQVVIFIRRFLEGEDQTGPQD